MTNFGFLKNEWPELFASVVKAESLARPDPRTACFYARRSVELAVDWAYDFDTTLNLPYESHLAALLYEPTFKQAVGPQILQKAVLIKNLGNQAVHSRREISAGEAEGCVRELFHVCWWLATTYARRQRPPADLQFNPGLLPKTSPVPPQTQAQMQRTEAELAASRLQIADLQRQRDAADAELVSLRAAIAEAKQANATHPPVGHDYNEAETRALYIDVLLREAGWPLDARSREVEVAGMPSATGKGYVDYVLWDDDGRPLALVEAKRTGRSPHEGQHQAKLYADCLEQRFGQRPVIFYSNGYETWLWDDCDAPPRLVQGFYKKDELQRVIQRNGMQRRGLRQSLAGEKIDPAIVERYYQTRSIRKIGEAFEQHHERRALLVMATGAGKTRTVIALCDLLMRSQWVHRVLFLADRRELVRQAVNAFKTHLPSAAPVNLCEAKAEEGRVYVATYPTMMNLIEADRDGDSGERRFGVGHFDLVVIDEAHRSVYQKYKAIFEYFDARVVGLTATPKDEVDHNTYELFHLQDGMPTDSYDLAEAVRDGFLVDYKAVKTGTKFLTEGIHYDDLSPKDQEKWDALEWNEDGEVPDSVAAEAINQRLFNIDTVDKVLEHLMTRGLKVNNGDRLGKTIIFARNQKHAEFIAKRFDANYPEHKGTFAAVIHNKVDHVQSLIDDFKGRDKAPHIAISVDMLDTGVDIPEVVNLVFFKPVRSRTKFWQMIGRGTRLCKDLFGPGRDKQFFYIFDHCGNFEFFRLNPETSEGSMTATLGAKLFARRVELLAVLDAGGGDERHAALREQVAARLQQEVAGMNLDNFLVRPQRRVVERFAHPEAWASLSVADQHALASHVAGLPSSLVDDDPDARQFDLLMLRGELDLLRGNPLDTLRRQLTEIAARLEEKKVTPWVQEQLAWLQQMQTEEWWQGVTAPLLDETRARLRRLIKLIDKSRRLPLYIDFPDELGEEQMIDLPRQTPGVSDAFESKAGAFLRQHEDEPAIHKLRWNEPLTAEDLTALEKILIAAGHGQELDGMRGADFGLFLRNLAGLNRAAANQAFASFLQDTTLNGNQIEFIHRIINDLTQQGWIDPDRLFGSPYTDLHPRGVDGLFPRPKAIALIGILNEIRQRATAA